MSLSKFTDQRTGQESTVAAVDSVGSAFPWHTMAYSFKSSNGQRLDQSPSPDCREADGGTSRLYCPKLDPVWQLKHSQYVRA